MTSSDAKPSIESWQAAYGEGPKAWISMWSHNLARAQKKEGFNAAVAKVIGAEEMSDTGAGGSLCGVPWMLKDLFDVAGRPTTASSVFLSDVRETPTRDSALVAALQSAGAVLAGKTHLNEFAYGLDGVNTHFGTVPNPVLPGRIAGGSSSGSAWAVASGLVPFAVGTDTGGSIRVPAAFCGLYGFRMTPEHEWSNEGCFPLAKSYDTAGFLTRSAEDLSSVLSLIEPDASLEALPSGLDLTKAYEIDEGFRPLIEVGLKGWTRSASEDQLGAWKADSEGLVAAFNILQSSEALALHRDWLHVRKADYDPATWQRIARAEQWSETDKELAMRRSGDWCKTLARWIEEYGYVVLPTAPSIAPLISEGMPSALREGILAMTAPASLAGHPVLSIPLGNPADGITAVQVILPKGLNRAVAIGRSILASAPVSFSRK